MGASLENGLNKLPRFNCSTCECLPDEEIMEVITASSTKLETERSIRADSNKLSAQKKLDLCMIGSNRKSFNKIDQLRSSFVGPEPEYYQNEDLEHDGVIPATAETTNKATKQFQEAFGFVDQLAQKDNPEDDQVD